MAPHTLKRSLLIVSGLAICFAPQPAVSFADSGWPDMARPAKVAKQGKLDAALIVGIENYAFVPTIPGARLNAEAWYDFLTQSRGAKPENIILLRDADATAEAIREAAKESSLRVGRNGTLWFVFIGHGAPSKGGDDGVLVGVDAQQKASNLFRRSVRQGELAKILSQSKARTTTMIIDACFSGRGPTGAPLLPGLQPLVVRHLKEHISKRVNLFVAAKQDQFAGPLPGSSRPAFSYLILGALRGWGDENRDGQLTAAEAVNYATRALKATVRDRIQTPEFFGDEKMVIASAGKENGPDLASLAKRLQPGPIFAVTALARLPVVRAPTPLQTKTPKMKWDEVNIDELEAYDHAVKIDRSEASPKEKAAQWSLLATKYPKYRQLAQKRNHAWTQYAKDFAVINELERKRQSAMNRDWKKLGRLLKLSVVDYDKREEWARVFLDNYGVDPEKNPYASKIYQLLPSLKPRQKPPSKNPTWDILKRCKAGTRIKIKTKRGKTYEGKFMSFITHEVWLRTKPGFWGRKMVYFYEIIWAECPVQSQSSKTP